MVATNQTKPVVVGVTGASGSVLAFRLMGELLRQDVPVELVMTEKALQVIPMEMDLKISGNNRQKAEAIGEHLGLSAEQAKGLQVFSNHEIDAPPASGTHLTRGMVLIPCSMGTLAKVAHGLGDNLVARAADVVLKEHRKLIVIPRESPFNMMHLQNMLTLSQAGVVLIPPVLSFYHKDFHSLDGQINYTVGKVLDHLGLEHCLHTRWGN